MIVAVSSSHPEYGAVAAAGLHRCRAPNGCWRGCVARPSGRHFNNYAVVQSSYQWCLDIYLPGCPRGLRAAARSSSCTPRFKRSARRQPEEVDPRPKGCAVEINPDD